MQLEWQLNLYMKPDFKFSFAPEVFSASAFDLPIISIVSVRAA